MNQKEMIREGQKLNIPYQLKDTQEWFAGVITGQLEKNNYIKSISPSGILIAEEAVRYIVPSPTLRPHQRIQIYNQQYWWRLLNTLHDNFPLLTRLFGYHAFNEEIAIPYLLKYPPNHWSINLIGERLTKWIAESYKAADQPLILNAASLDWAFNASFLSPQKPPLDLSHIAQGANPETLLSYTFYLQPHVFLFKWEYDLFTFRDTFLKKDVDYWTNNDFPSLEKGKTYYCVLYRTLKNQIVWKELSAGEYALLQVLQKGSTIESACEYLEKQESAIFEEAVQNLQKWFQDWTLRGWLTTTP